MFLALAGAQTPARTSTAGAGLSFELGRFTLEVPLSLRARFEDVGAHRVDLAGNRLGGASVLPQVRVGLRLDSKLRLLPFLFLAEYEHEVVGGYATDRPELDGLGLPASTELGHTPRKAYARLSLGPYLHAGGGLMTSHWGLGLVANDGAHLHTPGSAVFTDPEGGDRVLRLFLATGPVSDAKLFGSVAFDFVQEDENLLGGDSAQQLVFAAMVGRNQPDWLGLYVVRRWQEAADGAITRATVLDVATGARLEVGQGVALSVEAELAFISGTTALGASPEHPERALRQLGAALRSTLTLGRAGLALDVAYASGDGDLDDDEQRTFRADPNYSLGLILYRQVLAGQTGRSAVTAADPQLLGVPPAGVERLPSRGGVSNSLGLFPRLVLWPVEGLELYGGPLFAFSAAPLLDPLRSRVAGGAPRNAFDGDGTPGYLGTEIDLGARYHLPLGQGALSLGLELGSFLPGAAFQDAQGSTLDRVDGGRFLAEYRI